MKIKLLKEWEGHNADDILSCEDEESQAQAKSLIGVKMAVEWTPEMEAEEKTKAENETAKNEILKSAVKDAVAEAVKGLPKNDSGMRLHVEITKDEGEEGFKSIGDQLLAVMRKAAPAGEGVKCSKLEDRKLMIIREKGASTASGLNERVDEDGGFLVQEDFQQELFDIGTSSGEFASLASMTTLTSNADRLKWNEVDNYNRTEGSHYGGITVYRAAEAELYTKSKPQFIQRELAVEKMIGLYYGTDEIEQDAGALSSMVGSWFGEEFGFRYDAEMFGGTGAGQMLGITNSDAFITVTAPTGQTADTFDQANVWAMWARMDPRSRANAIWFMNNDVLPQLPPMKTGDTPIFQPDIKGAIGGMLLGRPVVFSEHCKTVGDANDVILVDWSKYMLLQKGGLSSQSSIHVRFLYGENTYRFQNRINGTPKWSKVRTPLNGSTTTSPYVGMGARA